MDIVKVFGKNLKRYRLSLGFSQEKLAEKCGLHRTYIGSIERFQRNVSLKNVQKIANAFNIEPYRLLMDSKEDKK